MLASNWSIALGRHPSHPPTLRKFAAPAATVAKPSLDCHSLQATTPRGLAFVAGLGFLLIHIPFALVEISLPFIQFLDLETKKSL